MGRPRKHSSLATPGEAGPDWDANNPGLKDAEEMGDVPPSPKSSYGPKVKVCHLAIGVDLLGSKTSLQTKGPTTLEMTSIGIRAHSKNSNRTVIIPYSNVKGFELFPGE